MSLSKKQYKKMDLYELIIEAKSNNYDALEEIIKREQKSIYAAFCYLGENRENLSDITQEALLRMAKNIKGLKNPKMFKSWLSQIITNLFYDGLRKKKRTPENLSIESYWQEEDSEEKCPLCIGDTAPNPDEKLLGKELSDIIRNKIISLPEHFRLVIVLRELGGLSYEEIAKVTGISEGTVKSRISRARTRLQNGLKPYLA